MVHMVSSMGVMLQNSSFSLLISWICPNISMKKHSPESFIFIFSSMGITWRFSIHHICLFVSEEIQGRLRQCWHSSASWFWSMINASNFLIIIRQITLVSTLFCWYLLEIPIMVIKKMTNCFSLTSVTWIAKIDLSSVPSIFTMAWCLNFSPNSGFHKGDDVYFHDIFY